MTTMSNEKSKNFFKIFRNIWEHNWTLGVNVIMISLCFIILLTTLITARAELLSDTICTMTASGLIFQIFTFLAVVIFGSFKRTESIGLFLLSAMSFMLPVYILIALIVTCYRNLLHIFKNIYCYVKEKNKYRKLPTADKLAILIKNCEDSLYEHKRLYSKR